MNLGRLLSFFFPFFSLTLQTFTFILFVSISQLYKKVNFGIFTYFLISWANWRWKIVCGRYRRNRILYGRRENGCGHRYYPGNDFIDVDYSYIQETTLFSWKTLTWVVVLHTDDQIFCRHVMRMNPTFIFRFIYIIIGWTKIWLNV